MRIVLASLVFILACCSSTTQLSGSTPAAPNANTMTNTMDIIKRAAESAPQGVPGEYLLTIQATGTKDAMVYLNTELDYRDQRNVTVAIHPTVVAQLQAKYGVGPEAFFTGKKIMVKGSAQRVRVDFISANRRQSGKYYYQTHIPVLNIAQIEIVNDQA